MTSKDVVRFFTALSRRWTGSLDVILIGGAAAVLAGSRRMTRDVDFEVRLGLGSQPEDGDGVAEAIRRATLDSGVRAQFAVDIERWSDVALPGYRASARPWKRFGTVRVKLLAPAWYVASKLRRGARKDFDDAVLVGRATRLAWRPVARTLGDAVRASPPSTHLPPFKARCEYFFERYGRLLWGPRFDSAAALIVFRRRSVKRPPRQAREGGSRFVTSPKTPSP